jgi:hypothetical protein
MGNKYELAHLPSALWNDPFLPTDRLFDNIFSKTFPEFSKTFGIDALQKASYPKVNILETDSEIKFVRRKLKRKMKTFVIFFVN